MNKGFTKGLIIGSIMGASVSMMMNAGMAKDRNRKKMMKSGRNFFKKSGHLIGDIVSMFR
jgi:gas vesicle protein